MVFGTGQVNAGLSEWDCSESANSWERILCRSIVQYISWP